jgi:hypothetical protein
MNEQDREKYILEQLKDLMEKIEKKNNMQLLWNTLLWVLALFLVFAVPILVLSIVL